MTAAALQAAPPWRTPPPDDSRRFLNAQTRTGNAAVAAAAVQERPIAPPPVRVFPPPLITPPGPKPKGNPGLWERFKGAVGGAAGWGMEHVVRPLRELVARAGSGLMRMKDMIVSDFTSADLTFWDFLNPWHIGVKMFFQRWHKFSTDAIAAERRERAAAAAQQGSPPGKVDPGPIERMDRVLGGMESMAEGAMGVQNEVLEGAVIGDFKENPTVWNTVGQIAIGFVPYAGQVADARDTIASLIKLRKSGWKDPWEWANLALTLVAWVPGVGDVAKGIGKGVLRTVRGGGGRFLRLGRRLWSAAFRHGGTLLSKARRFGARLLSGVRRLGGRLTRWIGGLGRGLIATVEGLATGARRMLAGALRRVDGVLRSIRASANGFLDTALGLLRRVPGVLRGLAERAIGALRRGVDAVLGMVRRAVEAGRRLVTRLLEMLRTKLSEARNAVVRAGRWVADKARSLAEQGAALARRAWNDAKREAARLWDDGKARLAELADSAKTFIKQNVIEFVGRTWRGVKERFVGFFRRKWEQFKRKLFGEKPPKPKPGGAEKAAELPAALLQARAIAEANERMGSPVPVVLTALTALKARYRWIDSFFARPKAAGAVSLHLRASDHEVDPDYRPRHRHSRLVGRSGREVFGETRFRGLVRERPLRELTHQEIYRAFRDTPFQITNHGIMRLKDPRTRALGMLTLKDFERVVNNGIIELNAANVAMHLERFIVVVDVEFRRIISIVPS
ncbi:hypothetical protein DP939_28485 [Spongiactinospora rosea]|uniref:Uncharacterized protein n=1 Tax=Spongiactinospora rosea TaxID=2248750 RepID=A0A366LTJ8_9ACTN|nr:hypothetical protein [Spongiactinospora rosea]RBQ16634.1 hypothetical protein DP939_28485 [Spongiactinospora rosea]